VETASFERGPYLIAAVLCERTLQEADGTLSIMRIVDKVTGQSQRPGETIPAAMPPLAVSLELAVVMKSGEALHCTAWATLNTSHAGHRWAGTLSR
jgi:hypothetical protein